MEMSPGNPSIAILRKKFISYRRADQVLSGKLVMWEEEGCEKRVSEGEYVQLLCAHLCK
jgi:hypothetical protein